MADILNNLNSANYITVKVTDDPITNGNNLLTAYARAKTTNPNGTARSDSNRLAVILPPAVYDLGTNPLVLDTQYIDIMGSTDDRSRHHVKAQISTWNSGTFMQTADNIKIYNIKLENNRPQTLPVPPIIQMPTAFYFSSVLSSTYIENVEFIADDTYALSMPTYKSVASSTSFVNCKAGDLSFMSQNGSHASGYFENCIGGSSSFAGNCRLNGSAAGTFIKCSGGYGAFAGSFGLANGYFKDCIGGMSSFGGDVGLSHGYFENCQGGDYAFLGNGGSGTFINCVGGNYSFGAFAGGNLKATFINCRGGTNSFGIT